MSQNESGAAISTEECLDAEIVTAIGLFLIGLEREGLRRYGQISYAEIVDARQLEEGNSEPTCNDSFDSQSNQ
jgi:hypothetical protein